MRPPVRFNPTVLCQFIFLLIFPQLPASVSTGFRLLPLSLTLFELPYTSTLYTVDAIEANGTVNGTPNGRTRAISILDLLEDAFQNYFLTKKCSPCVALPDHS